MIRLRDIYLNEGELLVVYLKCFDGTFERVEISVDKDCNKEIKHGISVTGRCILGLNNNYKKENNL